jgi:alpha-amylase
MVDVVNNHMGYLGCGTCVDYSEYAIFNQQSYFHPYCATDYSNLTSIQVCWEGDNTVSLPDLRTEDSDVRTMWYSWIKGIVTKYSIDGLRMDSAEHVEKSFWPGWESASGVYNVGEVGGPIRHSIPGLGTNLSTGRYTKATRAYSQTG